MVGLLRQKGKDVRVVNASPTPPRYDFLDPERTISNISALRSGRPTWPTVKWRSSSISRPGTSLATWPSISAVSRPRVVIDHHLSQDDLGATFLKDTSAEATGILVMRAIHALAGKLTREVATGLLTAIAMDTGWFRHTNTRSRNPSRRGRIDRVGGGDRRRFTRAFSSETRWAGCD